MNERQTCPHCQGRGWVEVVHTHEGEPERCSVFCYRCCGAGDLAVEDVAGLAPERDQ